MSKLKPVSGADYWITYVEVDEQEYDGCRVDFDSSPPEPDVNFWGDLEITSVDFKGTDLLDKMSKAELDNLLERTDEYLCSYYGDDPRI